MNQAERTILLAGTPLFKSLPPAELEHLAGTLPSHEFTPGSLLMREGEKGRQIYILLEGEVEVIKALGTADERPLGVHSPVTVFGEMGLFDPEGSHTASVKARTPVCVLEMPHQDFDGLLQRHPAMVYNLARTLSLHLENTENATILDLREKNRELSQAYQELQAAQDQLIIKERLEKELAIARQIQESILPESLPRLEGFDIAALTVPAREVGGDYYDFIPIDHHRFGLVIGDACDKGIPAALYINITSSLIHIEAPRTPSPEATLQLVNHHLQGMSRSGMFVTLLYGILDVSGHFDYCRAGHPPPLVLDGSLKPVQVELRTGLPLGVQEQVTLDAQSISLPPGGVMLIYSDGLTEAQDVHGHQFGAFHLAQELPALCHLPAEQICARLWEQIKIFCGDQLQADDFSVIVIKRSGKAGS
jgi:sigma-B regulation protein RsbU (phosphoserine phosphatase)